MNKKEYEEFDKEMERRYNELMELISTIHLLL